MAAVDLGKAHVKVVLSSSIPGVERDVSAMRKTSSITISMDSARMQHNGSFGVMEISMMGENENKMASAIMPVSLFEPVDNFFWEKTNTPTAATTDVYWNKLPFNRLSKVFSTRVLEQNPKAKLEKDLQKWKSTVEEVSPLRFSESEYEESGIGYQGEGWLSPTERKEKYGVVDSDGNEVDIPQGAKLHLSVTQTPAGNILVIRKYISAPSNESTKTDTETTETTDDPSSTRPVEVPESSSFARQYEALPSVWWAITSSTFKGEAWPFWVVIRTHSINLRKDKDKSALLSIRVRDSSRDLSEFEKRANGESGGRVKDIELVIDTNGVSTLHWRVEEGKKNTGTGREVKDSNGNTKKTTSRFSRQINLPEISAAFSEGNEIRVGFIPIMGRLCIFSSPSSYDVVQFTSIDSKRLISYGLHNRTIAIQGYGCTASVQAFRMTFFNKAWTTLADKIPNNDDAVRGYSFPSKDQGRVKRGSLGNGCFICAPLTLKEQRANKANLKYSGSFREYKEVLLDANESVNTSRASRCDITLSNKSVGHYGMMHAWGQLHVVRHGKDTDIDDNDGETKDVAGDGDFKEAFWFVFLGCAQLQREPIIPGESSVDRKKANRDPVDDGHVGFSYLVALRSIKPKKSGRRQYDVEPSLAEQTEIVSDDITQLSVTSELDSAQKPTLVQRSGSVTVYNDNGYYTKFLSRARGIQIWMKWSVNENVSFDDDDLIFSGIAYGQQSSLSPGEQYVTFNCVDHWRVLESFHIKNSPFYDGFEITAVMEDISERGGIDFIDDIDRSQARNNGPAHYFLGSGLRIFDQAKYRFSFDTSLKDCLVEVIKNFEFYMYFDNDGAVHIAPVPGGFAWDKTNVLWNPSVKTTYYLEMDGLSDPDRLVIDSFEVNSTLAEAMFNVYLVHGVERVWSRPLLVTDSSPDSLTNPDDIGYLGYISELDIIRPDLNSEEACQAFLAGTLRRIYSRPGFQTTIKTIGHVTPYIPGEFIRIEDDPTGSSSETLANKFRVTRIEHQYNAGDNGWTTSIAGFQVVPAEPN